jgi:hypothetical protein
LYVPRDVPGSVAGAAQDTESHATAHTWALKNKLKNG